MRFQRRRFLGTSTCPYSARSPHSPEPCLWTDQNFATSFWKGSPRNIHVKLFKNLTCGFREDFLRISPCPYSARSPPPPPPPIHQSHVFGQIKISRSVFEKGHLRNNPVKLFQNLTCGFRDEDFLGTFTCPYSARSPYSPGLRGSYEQNLPKYYVTFVWWHISATKYEIIIMIIFRKLLR